MDDLISRQATIDAINHICLVDTEYDCTLLDRVDVRYVLSDLPSAQPERKTGHWIEHPEIETSTPEYLMFYECSECGDKQCFCKSDIHKKHFCNNCGAKMVEPQESEDCISREAVEKITWEEPSYDDALNVLTEVRDKVRALPSVTPQHTRWIPVTERLSELDEAIERYTNNAEYERTHSNLQGCLEFRQLAEWLKELKKLRAEQKDVYEKGYEDGYCYALEDSH